MTGWRAIPPLVTFHFPSPVARPYQNIGFTILVKFIFMLSLVLGTANLWLAVFCRHRRVLLVTPNGNP